MLVQLKLFLIVTVIVICPLSLLADELDTIIAVSLTNSIPMKNIKNNLDISRRIYNQIWLTLIPDAGLGAGYSFQSETTNSSYSVGVSISKGLSDLDGTINGFVTSDNNYKISVNNLEIEKRKVINDFIVRYSELSANIMKKAIKERLLLDYKASFKLINSRNAETSQLIDKITNEILLLNEEIDFDTYMLRNLNDRFTDLSGYSPLQFDITNRQNPDFNYNINNLATNNQEYFSVKNLNLTLSNNKLMISKKNRELVLPIINLGASFNYDILANKFNYGFSSGLSYPLFEIFRKLDDISIYKLQNENLNLDITNRLNEIKYVVLRNEKMKILLENKLKFLGEEIAIEKKLQNQYTQQFKNGSIDFHEYIQRLKELYSDEVEYTDTIKKFYVLNKRAKYGILIDD